MKPLLVIEKIDKNIEPHNFAYGKILDLVEAVPDTILVCLELGAHDLKGRAKIFSLGKEMKFSKFHEFFRFLGVMIKKRKEYDTVLVYKTPVFVVFGGLLWRLLGKKIVFWYNHSYSGRDLKIAEKLVHKIVSPTENGFPLPSKKFSKLSEPTFLKALE